MTLTDELLAALHGGLWHTTSPERFDLISRDRRILVDPDIPDADRWATARGPEYFPYVRTLAGVSLFDFCDFDRARYSHAYPMSSWAEFVPFRDLWGASIWIEIDRAAVRHALIPPAELVQRWKDTDSYRHRIMPHLEAAHLGPIASDSWVRTVLVDDRGLHPL